MGEMAELFLSSQDDIDFYEESIMSGYHAPSGVGYSQTDNTPQLHATKQTAAKKPSIKQIKLVGYILRHNHFLEEPECTAKAYWQFIHDNEALWKRPRYEPDEDDLYMTCVHDVWCEEY